MIKLLTQPKLRGDIHRSIPRPMQGVFFWQYFLMPNKRLLIVEIEKVCAPKTTIKNYKDLQRWLSILAATVLLLKSRQVLVRLRVV